MYFISNLWDYNMMLLQIIYFTSNFFSLSTLKVLRIIIQFGWSRRPVTPETRPNHINLFYRSLSAIWANFSLSLIHAFYNLSSLTTTLSHFNVFISVTLILCFTFFSTAKHYRKHLTSPSFPPHFLIGSTSSY